MRHIRYAATALLILLLLVPTSLRACDYYLFWCNNCPFPNGDCYGFSYGVYYYGLQYYSGSLSCASALNQPCSFGSQCYTTRIQFTSVCGDPNDPTFIFHDFDMCCYSA